MSAMHFIDEIIDRHVYINILEWEPIFIGWKGEYATGYCFYQEYSPKHTAAMVLEWPTP